MADAYHSYSEARDLDHNPFRALSAFNQTLKELAESHTNVRLVDAEAEFRARARGAAPGFDLFLDYVHPGKRGNLLLARLVFDAIAAARLIGGLAPNASFEDIASQGLGDPNYSDEMDYDMQVTLLELSVMMHQYETALEKARLLAPHRGALVGLSSENDALIRQALETLPEVVDIERDDLRGNRVSAERRARADAMLRTLYRSYWSDREDFERALKAEEGSTR